MIVTKTYLSKCNTIVRDSHVNLSLNPILEINYGKMLTRGLIYFDHNKIKNLFEDKTYPELGKMRHTLKMTNCASITNKRINQPCMTSEYNDEKERAISFDLIFFLVPNNWDDGRGFDYVCDLYERDHRSISCNACNWYGYKNFCKWGSEGIYDIDKLLNEYDLFTSKENLSKIIIGRQHFQYGNENIELDITETFNKFITGELDNYGLCIAFAPNFETLETCKSQYVGFFTQHTNSFYQPYVETIYDEYIADDRTNFYLDKDNKLYFYASVNGSYVNLDQFPTCTINGEEKAVKQATKGIYYVDINLSSHKYEADTMIYDTWDDIVYKKQKFPSVELNFVTKLSEEYFSFGLPTKTSEKKEFMVSLYGINEDETIKQGDLRKVNVECRVPYTTNIDYSVNELYYRLYTKEAEKQIDIIDWKPLERGYNENYFYINTEDLIPFRYYVDIKICNNNEISVKNELLRFDVADNVSDKNC